MGRPKIHDDETVKIIFRMTPDLRKRLKVQAALLSLSMQALFVELIERGLSDTYVPWSSAKPKEEQQNG